MTAHRKFPLIILAIILLFTAQTGSGQTAWQKYVNNPAMTKDTTIAGIWEWGGIGQPACVPVYIIFE
jgi:hypothetical protein